MKTVLLARRDRSRHRSAFSLVEVMIASAVTLVLFVSFYPVMNFGIATIRVARENLRATQIMVNRMEGLRLFTWTQLTTTNLLPVNFTENYYPNGTNGNQGITYTGTVNVAAAALPTASYSSNLYQVTINLNWTSGNMQHSRQMSTYCAKYGVQNYVWSNPN